jgi:hypothetical protein
MNMHPLACIERGDDVSFVWSITTDPHICMFELRSLLTLSPTKILPATLFVLLTQVIRHAQLECCVPVKGLMYREQVSWITEGSASSTGTASDKIFTTAGS